MTLSRMPTPSELFNVARTEIFAQHGELRTQLGRALSYGDAAASGNRAARDMLPQVVIASLAELKSHLAYEESVLVPILAASGQTGRADAVAMVRQHKEQRDRFDDLVDRAGVDADADTLSATLRAVVNDVLTDMADEEQQLARDEIVAAGEATAPFLVELRRPH
jgi:hypothetical protein